MLLKIAYNDKSEQLVRNLEKVIPKEFPLIELKSYQEEIFKERKKAYALKYTYGTDLSPFAILYDENGKAVEAFYSEDGHCTYDNIIKSLNSYIAYGSKSNQ